MNQPTEFYISSGRLGRMYTLRRVNNDPFFGPESDYVRNLSNNSELANSKALAFVNNIPNAILISEADFALNPRGKAGNVQAFNGHFTFGKYKDESIQSVFANDPKYVAFIFQSNIKNIPELILETNDELFELVVDYIQTEYFKREREQEKAVNSNYVGNVKDKIELEVTLLFKASFEGYYDTIRIYCFEDADGNQLVWKSSSILSIKKGESVTIKATIKAHNEYRDVKQTQLTRLKIVENNEQPLVNNEVVMNRIEWGNLTYNEYRLNDQIHREDGPAIEFDDGTKEWWINGVEITEQEFKERQTND